jgi:GNAT superfamily N-acetyltransferase
MELVCMNNAADHLTIRTATSADADAIGNLVAEFQRYLHDLGDSTEALFGAEPYLRDGFGANPAFAGIVAERASIVEGYLLYHFGYDTDRAERLLFVIDLYVRGSSRGAGIGRRLMERAAAIGREHDARAMIWSVFKPNSLARRFYEGLGASYLDELEFMAMRI